MKSLRWVGLLLAVASVVVGAAAACGPASEPPLLVFAAASLTDALTDAAVAFEADHPDVEVELSFAGSSTLREQLLEGAPADVFASANGAIMDELQQAGVVDAPRTLTTNRIALVVPAGNPGGVTGLDDLARDDLLVGLCAEQVPCGSLARRVLDAAGLEPSVDTAEPDVRSLLARVELGEVDVAMVYASDVAASDGLVEEIAFDGTASEAYPVAVLRDAPRPQAAEAFVEFLVGSRGQAILEDNGFGDPS